MYNCKLCFRSFSRKWNLTRHDTHVHSAIENSNEYQAGTGIHYPDEILKPDVSPFKRSSTTEPTGNYPDLTNADDMSTAGESDCSADVFSQSIEDSDVAITDPENSDLDFQNSETFSECVQQKLSGGGYRLQAGYGKYNVSYSEDELDSGEDIFSQDNDNTNDADSETSSNEFDDCGSSSEDSGEDCNCNSCNEDSGEGVNQEGVQEGGLDTASAIDEAHDEDEESSREPRPKYASFARWRNPDTGLFGKWVSRSKKPFIVQHREWLKKLLSPSGDIRKQLIKEASDSQLDAIREIADNLLRGRTLMPAQTFKTFSGIKDAVRIIASEDSSYDELRSTLKAEHKFGLPLLLLYATPNCIKSGKALLPRDFTIE